jgi:fused signal recognition particle receptor
MDSSTLILVAAVALALIVIGAVLWARRRSLGTTIAAPEAMGPPQARLGRTATALGAGLRRAWGSGFDDHTWMELEETLLAADVGLEATSSVVAGVKESKPETPDEAREVLARQIRAELGDKDRDLHLESTPSVILVVGVNGTGKTTTIAKLTGRLKQADKLVVIAAADTFRAAAGAQLQTWGDRLGVDVVAGQEGGDPASVAYDAIGAARARGADVVIIDTAGRLHAKKNLMAELGKIHRVAAGERERVDEVLLVLDATGGQNGVTQVREFASAVPVTGIVLTKLDGTAKGGIVVAVERQLGVPVKFVGVGEGIADLVPFDPDRFVADLLEQS